MKKIIFFIVIVAIVAIGVFAFTQYRNTALAPVPQTQETKSITIEDKKITDSTKPFTIAVTYPAISELDEFNKKAEDIIQTELSEFKKNALANDAAVKENDPEGYVKYPRTYDLQITYAKGQVDENIVSVVFDISNFTGGAHGSNYSIALNYDVKNNKEIALADMFPNTPDYLKKVSDYCIKDLTQQYRQRFNNAGDDWIKEGAGPKAENFQIFMIQKDRLIFYFPQYQVAAYAAGPFQVTMPR